MTEELNTLQDGLAATIRTILHAYDQCTAPDLRAQLIEQARILSTQMSQIETLLFHQQTLETSDTLAAAFESAKGFTDQIDGLADHLEKVSDIVAIAGKVINAVTQIVNVLPA